MKPMLAATLTDINKIKFPVYVQPKLDGIRCLIINGQAVTRQLKPIPNKYIRKELSKISLALDGEIMLRNSKATFQDIQSAVMTEEGEPDFIYRVFDIVSNNTFHKRLQTISFLDNSVPCYFAKDVSELLKYEDIFLCQGYEGLMIRQPTGFYKFGRATEKEGHLIKMKRFLDAEAEIIGYEELIRKDGSLGNILGSLIVKDCISKLEFKIGTGFTDKEREDYWNCRNEFLEGIITYKYQELSQYGVPRFPVYMRERLDI